MNPLTFLAEVPSELSQYIPNLEQAYIILVVVVPVMIGFLLLIAFMMLISIVGVSDRLNEIRSLLEDIFSDKLNALDEVDRQREESERLARLAAIEERRKSVKPMTKNHKIIIGILAISIPILLIILIAVSVAF
jgi:amino acid transporter